LSFAGVPPPTAQDLEARLQALKQHDISARLNDLKVLCREPCACVLHRS
jgi:hypothetical protein